MNDNECILRLIAQEYKVEELANVVLYNWKHSFWSGSGHVGQHHYGKGGLVQHVREVTELAIANFKYFEKDISGKIFTEMQELVLACIYHDVGKIWDYEPVPEVTVDGFSETYTTTYKDWQKTKHARQIHHISRSAVEWTRAATGKVDSVFHDNVLHAILSHHGLREWGSPVAPASRVAWILHLSDSISARCTDVTTFDRIK